MLWSNQPTRNSSSSGCSSSGCSSSVRRTCNGYMLDTAPDDVSISNGDHMGYSVARVNDSTYQVARVSKRVRIRLRVKVSARRYVARV